MYALPEGWAESYDTLESYMHILRLFVALCNCNQFHTHSHKQKNKRGGVEFVFIKSSGTGLQREVIIFDTQSNMSPPYYQNTFSLSIIE
jgi:hypothetical protein